MAGHSKWANIQHRKNRQDEKKGRLWTKIIREITVSAKNGGPDPESNAQLRAALEKASDANIPKDNINRAIHRGSKESDSVNYEEINYEGYGINGSAIIVYTMTDNKVKTVSEVRHVFTKNGGNLGQNGSVSFLFKKLGQFVFPVDASIEKIMEIALQFDIEEIETTDNKSTEVLCHVNDYFDLYDKFKNELTEIKFNSDIVIKPINFIKLNPEESLKMHKLLLELENLEDVQSVHTNAVLVEKI
ncbi:hypothetical protein CDSE_0439 [Candidatus Kinetoplastibacterium desouzaii TCC079E]|uniref:Probable transcriptional regulatory protein CDSE_0439 n=1 Tax=Candidatus Kinetoplastidibacterium desouzai TCC079E TaxID=1208919 RepID=M1M3E8_9PROT|nr:YebC/PmpR family DNA-binding transcriptional regulator [Candidatus Kinetoplastibacterium desouzaii]AGF46760.1 hypothetical protein CDSE_0439 [Candidatus Kinetoplastibacterium desouzaii TCC079E]